MATWDPGHVPAAGNQIAGTTAENLVLPPTAMPRSFPRRLQTPRDGAQVQPREAPGSLREAEMERAAPTWSGLTDYG